MGESLKKAESLLIAGAKSSYSFNELVYALTWRHAESGEDLKGLACNRSSLRYQNGGKSYENIYSSIENLDYDI